MNKAISLVIKLDWKYTTGVNLNALTPTLERKLVQPGSQEVIGVIHGSNRKLLLDKV